MPEPTSFLQWVHQTYSSQWKGTVDITTAPADDHSHERSHWSSSITASGAVRMRDGKNITLEPVTGTGSGRSKRAAEQAAAEQIYRQLVADGWWDPEAPPAPKKSGGPSRGQRFLADNVPCNEHNPRAYLDISIAGQPAGRVVLELFRYKKGNTLDLHAPLAVDNFLAFCKGVDVSGRHLSYVGVPFTRVLKRFVVQAGDVLNKDGTGGAHIHTSYGEHFPDESLTDKVYRHTYPFMLSAANLGIEDTNSSQFFITVAPCASLDGYHTCFGKVLRGFGTVKEIEHVHLLHSPRGRADKSQEAPPVPVVITGAGELPAGCPLDDAHAPLLMGGGFPMWADDQPPPPEGVREVSYRLDIADQLKQQGNQAYKQGDACTALRRYRQAYNYLSWTTFKLRASDGDVDTSFEEQDSIWKTEGVLLSNIMAAQIKLGQYAAAVYDTCPDLLRRAPDNPKALLRAAQARIGLGPGEYDQAVSLLNMALGLAKEQKAPTRDIVEELHRVRDLRMQHVSRLRTAFSAAFKDGLLHHPADDEQQHRAGTAGSAAFRSSAAGRTWRGLPVSGGPVDPQRVLEDDVRGPVVVQDAWGVHSLVADDMRDAHQGLEGSNMDRTEEQSHRPLTELLLRQARLHAGVSQQPAVASLTDEPGHDGAGSALGNESDGWGGWSGGEDVTGDAVEGVKWWRDDADSSEEVEVGMRENDDVESLRRVVANGDKQCGDLQQHNHLSCHHPPQHQQQDPGREQQSRDLCNAGAVTCRRDADNQQYAARTNGHVTDTRSTLGAASKGDAAHAESLHVRNTACPQDCLQEAGERDVASAPPAGPADSSAQMCMDDVGVPEAVEAAAHSGVVLTDSSGITKQGYGWKPEALAHWSQPTGNRYG